jgi:hypothetical protein
MEAAMSLTVAALVTIPVLIELFTSEGCSSCPPADEFLRKIRVQQPVEGVEFITLSEHVDYWDYIGWKDPNAKPAFTARQHEYANHFRGRGAYTPQMVVDGQFEFVGSDSRSLARAVEQAAKQPKIPIRLRASGNQLAISLDTAPPANSELILALTQNDVVSNVVRGENQGRRLQHDSVVRHWLPLGAAKQSLQTKLPEQAAGTAVVFLQDRTTRRVLGAAAINLP